MKNLRRFLGPPLAIALSVVASITLLEIVIGVYAFRQEVEHNYYNTSLEGFVKFVGNIDTSLLLIILGLSTLYIVAGVIKLLRGGKQSVALAKRIVLRGSIGLVASLSLYVALQLMLALFSSIHMSSI